MEAHIDCNALATRLALRILDVNDLRTTVDARRKTYPAMSVEDVGANEARTMNLRGQATALWLLTHDLDLSDAVEYRINTFEGQISTEVNL